jgi:hypothetical protein
MVEQSPMFTHMMQQQQQQQQQQKQPHVAQHPQTPQRTPQQQAISRSGSIHQSQTPIMTSHGSITPVMTTKLNPSVVMRYIHTLFFF